MVIALLVLVGVDLIVLVGFVVLVVGRRRWVKGQPGSFAGIARVATGDVHQLGHRARRGYGRWVQDVLVWTSGPLCLRNAIVAIDQVTGRHSATDKVRRLGEHPQVITLAGGGAVLEIIVAQTDLDAVTAPFAAAADH